MGNSNRLAELLGLPTGTKLNIVNNPLDNSILRMQWNSPNDNKPNEFNIILNPKDLRTLLIRDNH